jgi:hypothetical protein
MQAPMRQGNMGDLIATELHGRYYESTYRRVMFHVATQAAQATTVALATTYTGLCVSNPVGSQVNLVMAKVGIALAAAPAAIAPIGIMAGYNAGINVTHTTPATPRSNFFGAGAAGVGLADVAATLPTAPVLIMPIMGGFTAAALPGAGPVIVDLEGGLILPPGAYAAIYSLTAVSGLFAFKWEEVPL